MAHDMIPQRLEEPEDRCFPPWFPQDLGRRWRRSPGLDDGCVRLAWRHHRRGDQTWRAQTSSTASDAQHLRCAGLRRHNPHHGQEPGNRSGHKDNAAHADRRGNGRRLVQGPDRAGRLQPRIRGAVRRRLTGHPDELGPAPAGRRRTRLVLLQAAAQKWSVPVSELTTGPSMVKHAASGRTISYGDLAETAATLPAPEKAALGAIELKDPKNYRIIGKDVKQWDSPEDRPRRADLRHRRDRARYEVCPSRQMPCLRRQGEVGEP